MPDYYMRGGDGREYGPVNADQLHVWLAENRANAQTVVRRADSDAWTTLGAELRLPALALPLMQGVDPAALGQAEAAAAEVKAAASGADTVRSLARELSRGAGWMYVVAALMLLVSALYAVFSFGVALIVMWMPIWAAIALIGAGRAARTAAAMGGEADLRRSLVKLRRYFVLVAIFSLIGAMVAPVIVAAFAVPALSRLRANRPRPTYAILGNLRQIASGAQMYMLDHNATGVAYSQIAGSGPEHYVRSIRPVAGERYDDLVITATQSQLSVSTRTGQTVTYTY